MQAKDTGTRITDVIARQVQRRQLAHTAQRLSQRYCALSANAVAADV
jgi:hypothetical protein